MQSALNTALANVAKGEKVQQQLTQRIKQLEKHNSKLTQENETLLINLDRTTQSMSDMKKKNRITTRDNNQINAHTRIHGDGR